MTKPMPTSAYMLPSTSVLEISEPRTLELIPALAIVGATKRPTPSCPAPGWRAAGSLRHASPSYHWDGQYEMVLISDFKAALDHRRGGVGSDPLVGGQRGHRPLGGRGGHHVPVHQATGAEVGLVQLRLKLSSAA